MKYARISIFIFVLSAFSGMAGGEAIPFRWEVGEVLVYNVRWSFIKLGELKLHVLGQDTMGQRKVYHCLFHIDSSPELPFIAIHDIYESYIDAETMTSHLFISYEKKKDHILFSRYQPDHQADKIKIFIERRYQEKSEIILDTIIAGTEPFRDSLAMLFYARAMAPHQGKLTFPVIVYDHFEYAQINFTGRIESIELLDQEIDGLYLDGKLKFVGIAGVREDFKGWFSTDPQRIPLRAEMKAFIGSVNLELKTEEKWIEHSIKFE